MVKRWTSEAQNQESGGAKGLQQQIFLHPKRSSLILFTGPLITVGRTVLNNEETKELNVGINQGGDVKVHPF